MKTKQEITSRLATIKKRLQALDLHTLTLRVEEVEKLIEEYISQLWTSPCICPQDEKTGETWCCNLCGKPTARTSEELPRDEDIYDAGMKIQDIETDEELTGFIVGCHYINSIASPLLASKDARIRELEEEIEREKNKVIPDDVLKLLRLIASSDERLYREAARSFIRKYCN